MSLNLSKNLFPSAEKIRAAATVSPLMMIDRNKLEFHPRNTEIYSVEVDDLFINNIAENGVIEPLIVIKTKMMINILSVRVTDALLLCRKLLSVIFPLLTA